MAYFSKNQDGIERGCKVLADIIFAAILLPFSIAYFGLLGGLAAFVILEAALIGLDYVVPNEGDTLGASIR